MSNDNKAGYEETFRNDKLSAVPGESKYFKCSKHCGDEVNRIDILSQVSITTSGLFIQKLKPVKTIV